MKKKKKKLIIKPDVLRTKGRLVNQIDKLIIQCLECPNSWNFIKDTEKTYNDNLILLNGVVKRFTETEKFIKLEKKIETDYTHFKFRIVC